MRTEGKNLRATLVIFGLGGTLAMGGVPEYAARSWLWNS